MEYTVSIIGDESYTLGPYEADTEQEAVALATDEVFGIPSWAGDGDVILLFGREYTIEVSGKVD